MTQMNETEREAFNRGWDDGEHNAINACFGNQRSWPHAFDTPEEEAAYERGYRNGYNAVD